MRSLRNQFLILVAVISAVLLLSIFAPHSIEQQALAASSSEGSLQIYKGGKPGGFCPLKHTDVKAGISGFVARVTVTQQFHNPSTEKIEAVYTFPLPQDSAVDDMTIKIGSRTIVGQIKRREEAAKIYQQAIKEGKTAALLDQERPNIFTQTVGNIPPGEQIDVSISYTVRLKYEDGAYEFSFPMVVGPRYIPGTPTGQQAGGFSPDTNKVPDASKITPPITPPGTRAGHDISIAVMLDAGVAIQDLRSPTHDIDVDRTGASSAVVRLRNESEIPNKDFVLRYDVAGGEIAEGLLTHTSPMPARMVAASANGSAVTANGYFTLILQPPARFNESDVTPKELVFVIDSSGSMGGFPIEKCKRLIDHAIDGLYPSDTFNVIKFSGETAILFDEPVYPTSENVRRAKEFVNANWGGQGTEMMKAIRAALAPSDSQDHVRIVVFLTDGYVGNDMEIIAEVQKHPNARVFSYGIGSSVNRFLLDKMAEEGRGEVEYVSAKQDEKEAETAATRLYERLRAPLLTDISIDFGSLPVADVYPKKIRDLFSARPVIITGRYTAGAEGTIRLNGKRAGQPYSREIQVSFPVVKAENPVVSSLWAREKVDDLMSQDWTGAQQGTMRKDLQEQVTQIGLDYRLMTQFTSFVAVEERVVTEGGKPKRVQVPVELPEDVQYEEQWSDKDKGALRAPMAIPSKVAVSAALMAPPPMAGTGSGGGIGGGVAGGVAGGVIGGMATNAAPKLATPRPVRVSQAVTAGVVEKSVPPTYPALARQARIQGVVVLRAVIDKNGAVSQLHAISGHPMLVPAAIEAVKQWKYKAYVLNGSPVEIETTINVNFALGGITTTNGATQALVDPSKPPRTIDSKLSPQLVAAYDCWQGQPDKSKAVAVCKLNSGRLLVRVVVTGDPATALQQLQAAGLEPVSGLSGAKQIVGRIAVEKLATIAEMSFVKFVTAQPNISAAKK